MIRFECDYSEGAHVNILNKLMETNMEQTSGYGEDEYCEEAASLIKKLIKKENADIHFMVGGTQTNLTVISSALRPHQSVICAKSGHINVHETGAIENCGHKVIALESEDGKITAEQILDTYLEHYNDVTHEHMTQPKMVYISNPTELGTIYDKQELQAIRKVCKENQLYLFLDGARLGYGLCAEGNDLDLPAIADCCDVFYIGGTKIGALFGEAIVITNDQLKTDFRYLMKQKGGMLAKGRLLGIQFTELFKDGLYFDIASHADRLAIMLKNAFKDKGYTFLTESNTNQQFVILPDTVINELHKKYSFSYMKRMDDKHSAVRFCTSWATKEDDVIQLIKDIKAAY